MFVDVYMSAFFAQHRPLSVVSAIPPTVPIEAFDSLFTPKKPSKKNGPAEVIYTLASAVQQLDNKIAEQKGESNVKERTDLIQALTSANKDYEARHLDGQPNQAQIHIRVPNQIKLVVQELANRFRPFNTPPAPVPVDEAAIEKTKALLEAEVEAGEEQQAQELEAQVVSQDGEMQKPHRSTRRRRFAARKASAPTLILNIEKTADPSTQRATLTGFFTPHETPLQRLQKMRQAAMAIQRQQQKETATEEPQPKKHGFLSQREIWQRLPARIAISVKRQRKLKMKKHKFRKLMRKTRNIRRRLDKL